MTTEEDDSEVMSYFWCNFLDKDHDNEINKLFKYILDYFAADSFHWFLKTTEEDLMEYKEVIYSSPSTSPEEKRKLDDVIEKFICCQWYAFYTLHTKNVFEMTAQEWMEVTSQDKYINFATSKYFQVKHNSLVCLLRENYCNDFISESPFVENEDVNKDELDSYANIKTEDVDKFSSVNSTSDDLNSSCFNFHCTCLSTEHETLHESQTKVTDNSTMNISPSHQDKSEIHHEQFKSIPTILDDNKSIASDYGEKNTSLTMDNGALSLEYSNNDNNIFNSSSCHSGLHYVDLALVPLLDHGEDSQSIHDMKSNKNNNTRKDSESTIDKNKIKDAESTRKDANGTTIEIEMKNDKTDEQMINNNSIITASTFILEDESLFLKTMKIIA
jgi:hypothetical protein